MRSLPSIPECSGISLQPQDSEDSDFVLQLFNGIDGRSGRLQWVLYRADTLGETGHGEGTGADTELGRDSLTRDVCSTIREVTSPKNQNAEAISSSTAEVRPSLGEWKASSQSIETQFSRYHYQLPHGFKSLSDETRRKENLDRYQTQRAEALKKQAPAQESNGSEGARRVTTAQETTIFPLYTLLLAAHTAPTTSESDQLPRAGILAHRRRATLMEAADCTRYVMYVPGVKVLRGPENVVLSGRNFVRSDFRFKPGDYLSKFCTVDGDYLFEFDFRADNEKDLDELVKSMQSIDFRP